MALVTKYGSFWGMLPVTTGRYFWVAPTATYTIEGQALTASDNNDGLAPDRALLTIAAAMALATANVGDVIVMLQGAHSVATPVIVAKAGLTFVGIPGSFPLVDQRSNTGAKRLKTSITSTQTAGICFDVNAVDTEIAFIHFAPPAAGGRGVSLRPLSGAANRTFIHDCTFALIATASTTTFGVTVPAGVTADLLEDVLISRCYFVSGPAAASGANGPGVNVLGTAHGLTVEQCTFQVKGTAAWATAILSSNAGTLGLLIRDSDFLATASGTAITNVIDTTGQTVDGSTMVMRCFFSDGSTKFVKATATPDIHVSECYVANATSGLIITK